jgi:hypothetical protein
MSRSIVIPRFDWIGLCWKTLAAALLILLWATVLARGQDASTGAIRGVVKDRAGALIPGATIALVNVSTGIRRSALCDSEGAYVFELLPPGDYSGRAESVGMSAQTTPPLHVEIGGTLEVNFDLSVAGVKETVTISGAPPLVETQPSSLSTVIDERAIDGLPLNGRRFTDLALLAPGVTQDPRGLTSSSNGDLAFGGVRGYQSSVLVDGSDNNNSFFAQARGRYRAPYQFSNEVVQEFRVSSNSYGAELGRSGGAVVNVVTKSGSNNIHGTGFYFIRDSAFNAVHPFVDFKPSDRQQQVGFTLGGPVKRNRAFFFAGFDQHIFHVPAVVRFVDGSTVLVPKKGAEPLHHGDYEDSDKDQVFAAAAQLSGMAGEFGSKLLGNAGFLKVDLAITPKHYLSGRLSTSRYYGQNNVFFDPSSPITNFAISDNGEENVTTESASLSLTSSLSFRLTSHLRAQYSRDFQESRSNSADALTRIYDVLEGFGRSTILPRQTREHRFHFAETLSLETGRHSWKLGGDALLSKVFNFFPSMFGGEYIFDNIKVDPWTFAPMRGGMEITPLRAYAHQVPRYYMQNFGSAVSHPDSNEYAWFLQDSIRVTNRLAVSLGARYDLQTFSTKELQSNPLWPDSGKVPNDRNNLAPRIGIGYSIGDERPLVIRAGYGMFYTRIPQIYTSAVTTSNGLNSTRLFLDHAEQSNLAVFPAYPSPLVNCPITSVTCPPAREIAQFLTSDVSAFSPKFHTPKVEQASLTIEREMAHRLAAGISYMYVHGEGLIRARDVNLPPPMQLIYPVYDDTGANFLGSYYNVDSFSSLQLSPTVSCPFTPCLNPVARPVAQLGAVNSFESAGSSVYHGMTVSIRRRMTSGLYFRVGYTFAHAIDDGQDALLTSGSSVQNSYSPAERGSSVTDQRHRLVFSWIAEPKPFDRSHELLGRFLNNWKLSGLVTYGSGRPVDARVEGDPNQDGNLSNDRLPGYGRNAFLGPDYATTDLRLSRSVRFGGRRKLEFMVESFNLLNRTNVRPTTSDQGFYNTAGQFVRMDNHIGINYFPASYRRSANFRRARDAYAPRQVQLAVRVTF